MDASQLESALLELENLLDRLIVLASEVWYETFAYLLDRLVAVLRFLSGRAVAGLRRVLPRVAPESAAHA
jgi:hypothetical protein